MQEELQADQITEEAINDNLPGEPEQSGEVGAKIDDTSAEVFKTVEGGNILAKIFGYLDNPGAEIERLAGKREIANDNDIKKAA